MGRQEEPSEEERMVMRECVDEAFWYRSLPLASATAILVRYGVSSGRIRPTKHGSWPVVVGATSLAYVLGKLSYIFGDNCHRKFLEKAPLSEIAQELKLRKPDMVAKVAKEPGVEVSIIPSVEQRNLGFANVLEDLDFETITEKEKSIMRDCNSIAFWSYSLPLSMLTAGAVFASLKTEFLRGSRWSSRYPRLPKMVVGGVLGYIAGQWIYVYTRDCPSRFIQYAPEGEIARRLGSHLCKDCLKKVNINEDNIEAGEAENDVDVHSSEYVIPSNDVTKVEEIIKDQCGL